MKKLFYLIAVSAFAISCRKDSSAPVETASMFKKNLIEVTAPGQSEWTMFYANDRKLLLFTNNEMSVTYKPGIPFSAKKTAFGSISDYKNAVQDAQGRVTRIDRYNSGTLITKQEFKYNADGYVAEQIITEVSSNKFEKYVYEYQAGNLVTMTMYVAGVKNASIMFDYYINQLNPIKIDLFDFKGIHFVTDEQFGKQSKNLVKSVKYVSSPGHPAIEINMSYTPDTDGYVKTITYSISSQAPIVYTCSFQ
ncbi:hypothetical protein [Lacibacter sediminis]|uniref:DUF4595 domain-containing protein n=1 Tax=Lacibacter sediminis TaxID=2760713 RepID=A0A7G5XIG6_9BACT|nr:hypothetical protein [Lacibacter sediminis]QNA45269.1 hypothetical protein H4075_03440 [Lacibacter sediminis]